MKIYLYIYIIVANPRHQEALNKGKKRTGQVIYFYSVDYRLRALFTDFSFWVWNYPDFRNSVLVKFSHFHFSLRFIIVI